MMKVVSWRNDGTTGRTSRSGTVRRKDRRPFAAIESSKDHVNIASLRTDWEDSGPNLSAPLCSKPYALSGLCG